MKLILFALVLILLAALATLFYSILFAPKGKEDEEGFWENEE